MFKQTSVVGCNFKQADCQDVASQELGRPADGEDFQSKSCAMEWRLHFLTISTEVDFAPTVVAES